MRYYVTLAGRTLEVDLRGGEVRVDGEPLALDVAALPGTTARHLLVDGRSFVLSAERGPRPGTWEVYIEGARYEVDVEDERTRAIRSRVGAAEGARGPRPLKAPMPGLVVRVEVMPGERVSAGQGIVIVEAMKMQNELKAEGPGVVSTVHAEAGMTVEKGTTLVEFDELPAEEAS